MKEIEFRRPNWLPEPTAWDKLPMQHKAAMLRIGVKNGLYSMQDIKTAYNRHIAGLDIYGEGGLKRPDPTLAERFGNYLDNGGKVESENSKYINKVGQRYYDYSRPDHPLTQNVEFREVVITPDSHLSPEERNYRERMRQKYLADYAEQQAEEYTARQLLDSQRVWENSAQKKALDFGVEAAQGIGMASDITGTLFGGVPVYSGMKGTQALDRAIHTGEPMDYVDAGIWLSPMLSVAGKKVYDVTKPIVREVFQKGTPAAEWAKISGPSYIMSSQEGSLVPDFSEAVEISMPKRRSATQRMMDFISGKDYQRRLREAGREDDWNTIGDYVEHRVNGEGYFPANERPLIEGDPDKMGSSNVSMSAPDFGVNIKRGLSDENFKQAIDHELAHWSTGNFKSSDMYNWAYSAMHRVPYDTTIGKMMRHNQKIAPTRTWEDFKQSFLPKNMPQEELTSLKKDFDYWSDIQERRANAYAMLQEAQRRKMSIDEFVDSYVKNGRIDDKAPEQMRYLGFVYTPDNIKRFMKGFLSVASPISFGIRAGND